jgi:hypothetical protein
VEELHFPQACRAVVHLKAGTKDTIEHAAIIARGTPRGLLGSIRLAFHASSPGS